MKGKFSKSGATVAHIGIGLILLGSLISNAKKEVISKNVKSIDLGKDFPNSENIMIEEKTDTLPMGDYYVAYAGKEKDGVNIYYNIDYYSINEKTGQKEITFRLRPLVQLNERMGNVAEPATQHFLTKDIYSHVTYAEMEPKGGDTTEYLPAKEHQVAIGDTFFTSNSYVILNGLNKNLDKEKYHLEEGDVAVAAQLTVEDLNMSKHTVEPIFLIRDLSIFTQTASIDELGLQFEFSKIDPQSGKLTIAVAEKKSNKKDFIILKAIIFPGINILWLGCLLMIIGTVMAVRQRIITNNKVAIQE
jgi:cytochrome c-type biogenesis protein CcmF